MIDTRSPHASAQPASIVTARHRTAWAWALACLMVAALAASFAFVPATLRFNAADPAAARYLVAFSATESNERESFRWSERDATLRLFGLTRRPLIVELRLASPRPSGAAPAETRLALGSWTSNPFTIASDWRRYMLMLPPRPGAPDLQLNIRTFRPARPGDTRRLGAALSQAAIFPADGLPAPAGSIATLGAVRATILILLPIAAFAATARLTHSAARWVAAAITALMAAAATAWPVEAVALLPDLWLIPAGVATAIGLYVGARPRFMPILAPLSRLLASDGARLGAVLAIACMQGMIFLLLVPPWQHYDEPAHFEYAWLLAFHPSWPNPTTIDPAIAVIGGEGRALSHPPAYHLLVSLPLRATRGLDIVTQLYLARGVSFALFIATIAVTGAIARTITSPGHPLRWRVPLVAALVPPFADIMTSVNNDVGAVFAFSLFLWSAVRAIISGLTASRATWVIAAALLAAAMKNVTLVAVPLAPVVLLVAHGLRRRWRWRRLVAGGMATLIAVAAGAIAWGDPAAWYRYGAVTASGPARIMLPEAVHGQSVLRLSAGFSPYELSGLATPVASGDLPSLAGGPVTVGAWVWASRPASVAGPGVLYNDGTSDVQLIAPPIDATTTPRFAAWTFDAPRGLSSLQLFLPAPPLVPGEPPLELFVDGVVLVRGSFSATTPPRLDEVATGGTWEGNPFTNLVRNASAEWSWPYVRPSVERASFAIVRRSPSRIVTSLLDIGRTGPIVLFEVAPDLIYRSFATFGWGEVALPGSTWRIIIPASLLLALAGCARLAMSCNVREPRTVAAIALMAIGALVWGNAALRILPALIAQPPPFPRYGFPAVTSLALLLAAGWPALWPLHRRAIAAATLVIGLLMLNLLAYATIWWRWYV